MPNAKAIVLGTPTMGTYIDTGNVLKLDLGVSAILVGDDGKIMPAPHLHAVVDPAGTVAALGGAVRDAVVAYGVTLGYTVTVTLLPSYTKL